MRSQNEQNRASFNESTNITKEKSVISTKPKTSGLLKSIISLLVIIIGVNILFIIYILFGPKFKNVKIELGTKNITINDFLIREDYKKDSILLTDISKLDLSKVGEYRIELSYKNKINTVKLKIVDTTAPKVVFQDIVKSLDYKAIPDDFIVSMEDLSEMSLTATPTSNFKEFKNYNITVSVTDAYGNVTNKECILTITWLNPIVHIELGTEFKKENIILDMEKDADKIDASEIAKVDTSKIGEYTIIGIYDGKEYTSKVIVQDTTAPTLELKDLTIFIGDTIKNHESFIKTVSDASGKVTTTLMTEIDYSITGTQEIAIEAIDINGNKTGKTAILTIKNDDKGPVFSGLSEITTGKNESVDYKVGVKAVDAKDGSMEFTVDSSKVNISSAGTYYAVYSSTDKEGNVTTANRKITVTHNQEDTNQKFDEFYNKYLAGKSVLDMVTVIRSRISYNHNGGGTDPIWYALNNAAGDCYVHAVMVQKALDKAGINNVLIHVKDRTHFWNLVEIDGIWRHYDSTPGSHIKGPATDDEKFKSSGMQGRNWDRDAFPKAI